MFPKNDNFGHLNNEYLKLFQPHFTRHEFLNIQHSVSCKIVMKNVVGICMCKERVFLLEGQLYQKN